MLEHHIETGGPGVTVAGIPVPAVEAREFGVIETAGLKIARFHEKSASPPEIADRPGWCLASMGNYVFDTTTLVRAVTEDANDPDSKHDLGANIIPNLTAEGAARWYDFGTNDVPGATAIGRGYWRDVGTLDAYYEANMDLVAPEPTFDLYNMSWPVYTSNLPLPPAKLVRGPSWAPGSAVASLLCQGSIISGGHVENSIISPGVYIDDHAVVSDSIVLHDAHIAPNAVVRRAIVDKNAVIGPGVRIGVDPEQDRARFTVSDAGVVVVEKGRRVDA